MDRLKSNYFIAFLWSLFILLVCFVPSNGIPKFSIFKHLHLDKWIHFFLFFIQSTLFLLIRKNNGLIKFRKHTNKILFIFFYCLILGLLIELVQHYFIQSRFGDAGDFISNLLGVLMTFVFFGSKKLAKLE
ncbi:MAG: VanZ family protein [Bacteroidota bacterium]|nr:VanZ family protein [Bacteroidota bacterium]